MTMMIMSVVLFCSLTLPVDSGSVTDTDHDCKFVTVRSQVRFIYLHSHHLMPLHLNQREFRQETYK